MVEPSDVEPLEPPLLVARNDLMADTSGFADTGTEKGTLTLFKHILFTEEKDCVWLKTRHQPSLNTDFIG